MSANFQIEFKSSNGNLHIGLRGDFDGSSAWELINLIHEKYDGCGRVYIDTANLGSVHPFGVSVFRRRLNPIWLPLNRLFLKGEKGLDIAPKGSKVVLIPENRNSRRAGGLDFSRQKEMTS